MVETGGIYGWLSFECIWQRRGWAYSTTCRTNIASLGTFQTRGYRGSNSFLVCNCLMIYSSRQSPSSFKDLYRAITNPPSPRLMVKEFGTQGMILILPDLDLVLTRNRAEKRVHSRKT